MIQREQAARSSQGALSAVLIAMPPVFHINRNKLDAVVVEITNDSRPARPTMNKDEATAAMRRVAPRAV